MKPAAIATLLFLVARSSFGADGSAALIATPGTASYEDNICFGICVGTEYKAQIPRAIRDGDVIEIRYEKDGKWIPLKFPVRRISTGNDRLCRLHTVLRPPPIGDVIYVRPCEVISR